MKLYNTLSHQIEEFRPQDQSVTMYACGPTVYDYAHIGNLRTYLNEDILRRFLEYSGFKVKEVMNITDIEDKIIKKANDEKIDYRKITEKYEKYFLDDLERLNIDKPEYMPKATEEIDSMIALVRILLDKGIAYKSEDCSVYFDISKFKEYGRLANLDIKGLKVGARVDQDEYDKENAQDFVLWKAKKEGEPSWPAPFGEGRPGWHIECSAMSMKYLGESIDLHAGAVDLIFPHHENEIAQSEAATGKKFVKYWFHGEHLMVNGQKMSKSLKNIFTLADICQKYGIEPLAFRMLCLQSHYREKLNFTDDSIVAAQNTLRNLRDFVEKVRAFSATSHKDSKLDKYKEEFEAALSDDLNSPKALAAMNEMITYLNKYFAQNHNFGDTTQVLEIVEKFDSVLALDLLKEQKFSEEAEELFEVYKLAKAAKDYEKSDALRAKLEKLGYIAEDSEGGYRLRTK